MTVPEGQKILEKLHFLRRLASCRAPLICPRIEVLDAPAFAQASLPARRFDEAAPANEVPRQRPSDAVVNAGWAVNVQLHGVRLVADRAYR